jgi:hypothetical protein
VLYARFINCVDNFVDSHAVPAREPRKINELAAMHAKMARHETLMNQRLSVAMGFVAIVTAAGLPPRRFCA